MVQQIRPSDLQAWLVQARLQGEPLVLDVREPAEVQVACIQAEGFELRCMPMGSIPPRLNELDAARPVACLCHHGGRSMQVASFLERQGFTQVANIAGGIDAWSLECDPTVPRY